MWSDIRRAAIWLFDFHLDVHSATVLAIACLAIFLVLRPVQRRPARFFSTAAFEVAVICALFALWQIANRLTHGHTTGGLQRGRSIWHLERVLRMPSEVSVQKLILGHPDIVRAANYYYDTMHLTLMFVFLVWLWLRHRPDYPRVRNVLALFTGMSLLGQMVAVAPPRLIGNTGLVDTAMVYHQSVYAAFGDLADQYAAMPSIHVGWALLISIVIVQVSPSRWRWLGVLHGAITCFVVVATANHYWLDGIAAAALLGLAWLGANGLERLKARVTLSPSQRLEPEPVQIQQGAFS